MLVDNDRHGQIDVLSMPSVGVTGTFWQTTQPVSIASIPIAATAATSAKQLADGHNVAINTALPSGTNLIGKATIRNSADNANIDPLSKTDFDTKIGEVQATPTANTVLARLKDLVSDIVLKTGSLITIEAFTTGFATAVNSKISVGSSSTTVLVSGVSRKFASFVNDSNEEIYLSLSGTAVINEGIRLNANGGSLEINALNLYTGIVTGICDSGNKNLTISYKQ